MIFYFFLLVLLLFLPSNGYALDLQIAPQSPASSAVILVIDGLGSSYVYPEHNAYSLDGSSLGKAILYNLTGGGARVIDLTVPVPETTKSHSVLVTGSSTTDPESLGMTIFDAARQEDYLCLAILERGDSMQILQEQDIVLYLSDNAIHGAEPIPGSRENVPPGLNALLQDWRDRFADYTSSDGVAGYVGYNSWGFDVAADIVNHLPGRPFLMLVNVGAVDSAGQNLGIEDYLKTIQAMDAPLGRLVEACRKNNCVLVVTADHGMSFPDLNGNGGHSAEKYVNRSESIRVPLVFFGPNVEEMNLGGHWTEMDIAPTVLNLLDISPNQSWEGESMPIKESYDLQLLGACEDVSIWQGNKRLANATGAREYNFRGLSPGLYTLKTGEISHKVLVNGDISVDLAETMALPSGMKKILGVILILAINLVGIIVIIRIIRK